MAAASRYVDSVAFAKTYEARRDAIPRTGEAINVPEKTTCSFAWVKS